MKYFQVENRTAFIFCILLSCAMWLINALSEKYTVTMPIKIQYLNLPDDKLPAYPMPPNLQLTLTAFGMDILKQFNLRKSSLVIDCATYVGKQKALHTTSLIRQIEEENYGIKVNNVEPDSIYFVFAKKMLKKVPIIVEYDINTARHFQLKSITATEPDSVEVSGPLAYMDTLKSWPTQKLAMRDVNQPSTGDIDLARPDNNSVKLSVDKTTYKLEISEFTEKQLSLPIQPTNLPNGARVFLYPNTVAVHFQVITDDFDDIEPNLFKVTADFSHIDSVGNDIYTVPLKLLQYPPNVKSPKVMLEEVEFTFIQ